MLKKLFFLFSFAIASCLLFFSCGEDYIFNKTVKIENGRWAYNNILQFDFEIADTSKRYDLLLEVEHAGDYGFQNLYVQFHTKYPSGEEKSQVVSLELAGKSGIWNGKCSGNSCSVEIPLQINAIFNEPGIHQLSVEQFMRKSPLVGVESLTLKVKKSEVK